LPMSENPRSDVQATVDRSVIGARRSSPGVSESRYAGLCLLTYLLALLY